MWGLPVRNGVVTILCADGPVECVEECGRWLQEDCIEGAGGRSSLELTLGGVGWCGGGQACMAAMMCTLPLRAPSTNAFHNNCCHVTAGGSDSGCVLLSVVPSVQIAGGVCVCVISSCAESLWSCGLTLLPVSVLTSCAIAHWVGWCGVESTAGVMD